jgi:glycosyltransferase involved in cell wall biosynthesis
MKIAYLVPGTGGAFYCGNCHRDRMFVTVMKNNPGTEVTAIPLYLLPNRDNFGDDFEQEVFFGAISLYIKERVPALRNMPTFIEKMLDSTPLLKFAARQAGSTTPEGLEKTTIGMITGDSPFLFRESEKLLEHLSLHGKPDIIHLSNALLTGLAYHIRKLTDIPVICSLQNEDDWINEMEEPYRSEAWRLIGKSSEVIERYVSSSAYYRDFIAERTGIDRAKIEVIHPVAEPEFRVPQRRPGEKPAIGFFSRLSVANGLDKTINAFIYLKKKHPDLQLHLSGGYTASDRTFVKEQIARVRAAGFEAGLHLHNHFTGKEKEEFFRSIDLLSVPVRKADAWGQYLIESISCGVPVVQPATGAFPEIVSLTGGGVIYNDDTTEGQAFAITRLLNDNYERVQLREAGLNSLHGDLSPAKMKERIREVYQSVLGKSGTRSQPG